MLLLKPYSAANTLFGQKQKKLPKLDLSSQYVLSFTPLGEDSAQGADAVTSLGAPSASLANTGTLIPYEAAANAL